MCNVSWGVLCVFWMVWVWVLGGLVDGLVGWVGLVGLW